MGPAHELQIVLVLRPILSKTATDHVFNLRLLIGWTNIIAQSDLVRRIRPVLTITGTW